MTQRELAEASGFAYETIRAFEYGRRQPQNLITLKRLIDALGVDSEQADSLFCATRITDADYTELYRRLYADRSNLTE